MKKITILIEFLSVTLISIVFGYFYVTRINNKEQQGLSSIDSRNRMSNDDYMKPIPLDGTGAKTDDATQLLPAADSKLLIDLNRQLPVSTDYFDIVSDANSKVIVYIHKSPDKNNMLQFYTWLTDNGYDSIDLSQIHIVQE